MSDPSGSDGAQVLPDARPHEPVAGEFEAVIRGLQPLSAGSTVHASAPDTATLTHVLTALVQSVADAQLATDIAAAKAVDAAARGPIGSTIEESENEPSAWAAGVLPSFYQIAEVTIDVNLGLHFAPAPPPAAGELSPLVTTPTGGADGATGPADRTVRIVLRQVPPPPAVMANLSVPPSARTAPIHFD
jgi:hypothetical protein